MAVSVKRRVIQGIIPVFVFYFSDCKSVLYYYLSYYFVPVAARQHQWGDSVKCYWEVHVDIVVYCSEVK